MVVSRRERSNHNQNKAIFSKAIKLYTRGLKQILCFQPIFLRGLLSLGSRGCYGMLWDIVTKSMF